MTAHKDNIPSRSNRNYFSSYEDIEIHQIMVADKSRTEAYRDAILKNKQLFSGRVAMDVGAGTGILSLLMAKAGARKVYAVEASNLAKIIPEVAKANSYEDVIVPIHSKVEDVILPGDEKVDIIVSEWMGFYLFHESMLPSVIIAREKFLSNDGIMFPSSAKLYACPCSLEGLYQDQLYFWDDVYGFNMSPIKNYVYKTKSNKPEIFQIKSSDLLSEPICVKSINLLYVTINDIKNISSTNFVGITKAGTLQGLALWFDCEFDGRDYDERGEEFGSLVLFSTSPFKAETHWKQTIIVFGKPQNNICTKAKNNELSEGTFMENEDHSIECMVSEDEVVGWKLELNQGSQHNRSYNISLEMCDPDETEHPIPCKCPMPRCLIISKMIEDSSVSDYVME